MFEDLINKYPCLWDSTNDEFHNKTYKALCCESLLKELNESSVPPYSMRMLKRRICSYRQRRRRIQEKKTLSSTSNDSSSTRCHEGFRCDVCRDDIIGFRYACVQCPQFDLCGACEARGEHATHYVLRVPSAKLNSDVHAVIQKIRNLLLMEDIEHSIRIEIKAEPADDDSVQEQDLLAKTCEDEPVPDNRLQDVQYEETKDSSTKDVKYFVLNEEVNQPGFIVESHQPKEQSHQLITQSHQPKEQSHQPKEQSHQPKEQSQQPEEQSYQPNEQSQQLKTQSHQPNEQSQQLKTPKVKSEDLPVKCHQKRQLTLEDSDTEGQLGGKVVLIVKQEAGGLKGGRYAVYTHRADDGSAGAEPRRKKRKK